MPRRNELRELARLAFPVALAQVGVLQTLPEPPDEVPCFALDRDLSYQLAPLVQIDGRWHQSLLELRDETYRLERLDAVFQAGVDRTAPDEEEGAA
ncbi:hypothetical protein V3331_03995 [Gaopeijia maritima]|uniref:hypothetical protein n=1 Tax=Gaopeijia maritima TaxID=3119007 RepID=UPI00325099DE